MDHRTDAELQAYLDAELDGAESAGVAAHLMVCTACRARLGELRLAGDRFRAALAELDSTLPSGSLRPRIGWIRRRGTRSALRAAVLLLAVAGAASAVVPGSPLRALIERLVSGEVASVPIEAPTPEAVPESAPPGITSVTVSPVGGRVNIVVRQFAPGTTLRVRYATGNDVRARLVSGQDGVRFSVGEGSLFVVGSESAQPSEILFELPRGLEFATLEVDGKRELVASPEGFRRPGDSGELSQDDVVLRVGG
ncbi:MAG: zf-HC2 domain-containing protein [marine benthic group bacterium]|nr:zf-HC2 domain-containing protein [Gemmatimonadota bacterium]MCL7985813.1 zf-HC2 domain-containing protein [Gemmatimonadota bacterium]